MEVNRQWWSGTTATVTDGSSAQNERYTYITDTLYSSIVTNSEKYKGEWDKTICPWKINGNADIMQTEFILPWTNGTNWTVVKSDFHKKRKKGYTFYLSCNGNNMNDDYNQNQYFANYCGAWLSMPSNPNYDITDTVCNEWTESKFGRINPIINFDYANIFVVPTVNGNELTPDIETNFNPLTIYNIGFTFYYKDYSGTNREMAAAIVSLNNEIDKPSWSEYNTNCFDIPGMYDNGFMLTPYWIEHTRFHAIPALGSRANAQSIPWRSRGEHFITGATGTGYSDTTTSGESAAATINYFPNKAIYISTGKSELWDNYEVYYDDGTDGFSSAVRRHLKSTVTYADFIEYIAKECAYLGFKFCLDSTHKNEDINSQYYFIPEIDEKGVTTGNYYTADSTEAQNLPNYNWNTNVYEQTPYDGTDDEEDGDPNDYDDENKTELNPAADGYSNEFQNSYVLPFDNNGFSDTATVGEVAAYLYYTAPTTQSETDYLSSNPIDAVVSLMMFPFAIDVDIPSYGLPYVRYGKVVSDKKALGFIKSQIQIIDFGSHLYYPIYGVKDFRSYEPYCDAELILPYCGNVKILPSLYLNHFIGVKYIVDLVTGACCACIFRDNLMTTVVNGQIGMSLPVTGVRAADLQSDIYHKQTGIKQAANTGLSAIANTVFGTVSAAASGNAVGAAHALVSGALNIDAANTSYKAAEYELSHIQIPFTVRSAASPLTDFANEQYPRLIIKRPIMLDSYNPEIYGHTIGFACLKNDTLNNYHGYTELTGLDFSGFGGTEIEKARLKAELENGVYLP